MCVGSTCCILTSAAFLALEMPQNSSDSGSFSPLRRSTGLKRNPHDVLFERSTFHLVKNGWLGMFHSSLEFFKPEKWEFKI